MFPLLTLLPPELKPPLTLTAIISCSPKYSLGLPLVVSYPKRQSKGIKLDKSSCHSSSRNIPVTFHLNLSEASNPAWGTPFHPDLLLLIASFLLCFSHTDLLPIPRTFQVLSDFRALTLAVLLACSVLSLDIRKACSFTHSWFASNATSH